ncbi:MAG: hypothetical protein KGL39_35170 [Patescibacteria group bacterium]|nr:hypothetical protein [Patescibacteria group bacterium]
MATIDSWPIVEAIIKSKGHYADDPLVVRVVAYTNAWGNRTWGIVYEGELDKYRYEKETEFVREPKVIFALEK